MYEFRFYSVAHGRLAAELALVHEMAFAGAPAEPGGPPTAGPSLWDRYGVPRPVGSWVVLSGRNIPGFLYLMKWRSLAERDDRFPRFWADLFWRARRAQLTDGMPLVESIENWLLDPSPIWDGLREPADAGPVGGLHELCVLPAADGAPTATADPAAHAALSLLKSQGGRVLGVFDLAVGPGCPAHVILLAWADLTARTRAWQRLEEAAGSAGTGRVGVQTAFADHSLLEPVDWNRPAGDLEFSR